MKRRVFLSVLAISLVAFIACQTIALVVLYRHISEQRRAELQSESVYFCEVVENYGGEFLSKLTPKEKEESAVRLTLINPDGTVAFDSAEDASMLENHGNREEVREALKKGTGESTRTSATLGRHTYNYAVRLNSGQVLRISGTQYTVFVLFMNLLSPMVLVLSGVVILAVILAVRISNGIIEPINAIDLANPDARTMYPELRPLASRINEQNRQIHKQMLELREEHERRDRYRREFTANVSHELKTPLTSISGYAELLRAGLVKEEDIGRFAGKIHDEAQRLVTLVGDIIRISQLEDGEAEVEKEPVDLLAVCERIVERLSVAAGAKNVRILVGGEPATVLGVPQIIDEMVYNLCDNAIKYNVEQGTVWLTVNRTEQAVSLSVQDTGIGIPEKEQGRVFERFYRVDKSHSREVGGTGLGLSIVKHGAAYHGAAIELESRLGEGTRIRVLFPDFT